MNKKNFMKLFIPGIPPSVNTYNNYSSRNGKIIVANKKTTKDYKKKAQDLWIKTHGKNPKKEKLKVSLSLIFSDERKRDIDNYSKVLLDSLTDHAWVDDSQICELKIKKKIQKDNCGVKLKIEELTTKCQEKERLQKDEGEQKKMDINCLK